MSTDDIHEFVERIKEAAPIEDVIDGSGAEFGLQRKRGNYLRGKTHDSLVVRVDERYYVWNAMGEKGDVFNWLEARNKWDFWTSLEWLAERAKLDIPKRFKGDVDPGARAAARLRENVLGIAQRLMAKWLWADEKALAYARERGWTDETIQEAGLGFSGRMTAEQIKDIRGEMALYEIDLASPAAAAVLGYKGDVRAWGKRWKVEVQENWVGWKAIPGLMGKTRLVYPHWVGGRVMYLSGRNILGSEINKEGREIKSWNPPVLLLGKRRVFFNHAYGRRSEACVCVEGQADAVTLGQWGLAAMAICGTEWDDHRDVLVELRKRHQTVYVGLDADEAGVRALVGKNNDWPMAFTLGPMGRIIRWLEISKMNIQIDKKYEKESEEKEAAPEEPIEILEQRMEKDEIASQKPLAMTEEVGLEDLTDEELRKLMGKGNK